MAKKSIIIGSKPVTTPQPNPEDWVTNRLQAQEVIPTPLPVPTKVPEQKLKRLTLDIPEPLHKAIKQAAAKEGVSMVDQIRELLVKHYLKDDV